MKPTILHHFCDTFAERIESNAINFITFIFSEFRFWQIIVNNHSLNQIFTLLWKGKAAAQCSHAAVGAYKIAKKNSPSILRAWERMGQPKIVTKVETEDDLLSVSKYSFNIT